MTKFTDFSRRNLTILGEAIAEALKDVGDKYGVDLRAAGGTYGGASGAVKISVNVRDTGAGVSGAKAKWDSLCGYIELKPEHYGQMFHSNGMRFKITGIDLGRPKYPVDAVRVHDGKSYKFPAERIRMLIPGRVAA